MLHAEHAFMPFSNEMKCNACNYQASRDRHRCCFCNSYVNTGKKQKGDKGDERSEKKNNK